MATTISGTTGTTPTLSSPGIGSGLDVNGIVTKLMAVESQPLALLARQEANDQAKISAYGSVKASLSALQTALSGLASPAGFKTLSAAPGDATVFSAAASASAVPGTYSLEVTQLAQAQKLLSAGFASADAVVGSGSFTFSFGSYASSTFTPNAGTPAASVTIGSGQTTLAGIRDAVNAAGIGVTATIVNDGGANGYHLVFTSTQTGAQNGMKITVADGDGGNTDTAGLSQLAYDPAAAVGSGRNLTEQVVAQDAQFKIDGIAMTKASNVVTDAIQGVTLTLAKKNAGSPTTLSVATDTSAVSGSVGAFVKAYNDLQSTLASLTKYDAKAKQGSVLTGDAKVRTIQSQLRGLIGGIVGNGAYTTLSQVGVQFQSDGTLKLDDTKLAAALSSNRAGVMQLFAAMTSSSDSLVTVSGYSARTTPGSYAVDVSRVATRGSVAGSAAAGLTITAGVDDQLSVVVDGTTATVTLAAGTYATADALAAEVQSKVNGASALSSAGLAVDVTQSGGTLTIASRRYGSASTVSATGSAGATLLGGAPVVAPGVDVAGSLGGVAATGSGQTLIGGTGGATEGLTVTVNGGAAGARGNVTLSLGIGYRLSQMIDNLVGSDGTLEAGSDGLQKEIDDIGKRRDALNRRLALVEANYRSQFNALDTLLASLSSQSTFLTQQLANLPKISNTNSSN